MSYCPECGKEIVEGSDFCSNCGTKINPAAESAYEKQASQNNEQQSTQQFENSNQEQQYENNNNQQQYGNNYQQPNVIVRNEKNAGLAAVLSFLIIGLGQIYNGEIGKGLILLIVSYVCLALFILIIPAIVAIILWIYAIYDAYTTAKKINEGIIQ